MLNRKSTVTIIFVSLINRYESRFMSTPASQPDSRPDNGGVQGREDQGLSGSRMQQYISQAAVDLYNRTPQDTLSGLSPYDAMYKRSMHARTTREINPTEGSVYSRTRSPGPTRTGGEINPMMGSVFSRTRSPLHARTVDEIDPMMESVFSNTKSPSQEFRFSSTTVENSGRALSPPHVFDDTEKCREEGEEKLTGVGEEDTTIDGRR